MNLFWPCHKMAFDLKMESGRPPGSSSKQSSAFLSLAGVGLPPSEFQGRYPFSSLSVSLRVGWITLYGFLHPLETCE